MNTHDAVSLSQIRALARSGMAKSVRLAAGLSLQEVAEAIGAGGPSTIHRWENGDRRPHGEVAVRYLQLVDELIEELGER